MKNAFPGAQGFCSILCEKMTIIFNYLNDVKIDWRTLRFDYIINFEFLWLVESINAFHPIFIQLSPFWTRKDFLFSKPSLFNSRWVTYEYTTHFYYSSDFLFPFQSVYFADARTPRNKLYESVIIVKISHS